MTYDALTMHAIRDELDALLCGGAVDAAYLIKPRCVGLDVYARHVRHSLVLSLDPADSRIYLSSRRVARGTDQVTPFLLLLRKYVRGSRLVAVEQPRLERVLTFRFTTRIDHGPPREVALIAEAMGRRSNLVLVDEDGAILDVLERVPPTTNPARPLLPHLRYTPPPAQTKVDPNHPGLAALLTQEAGGVEGPAQSLLVRVVAGMSPLLAREALARALGDAGIAARGVSDWSLVTGSLATLVAPVEQGGWAPSIAWRDGAPVAFASYVLTQLPDTRVVRYRSMSEVVERAGGQTVQVARFDRLRQPLLEAIHARAEQARRKRSSLERSLSAADEADALRWAGAAILANSATIPAGASMFEWEGRRIDLYPTLSAVENAQAYFRRYADARDARRVVPPLLDETERELAYLDEMALHVELAEGERELNRLRAELLASGLTRPASKSTKPAGKGHSVPSGAYRRLTVDGTEVLLGTSALGNETVTFRLAEPADLWFHVRGAPGAHVVLRTRGQRPSSQATEAAAALAAAHSALHHESSVEVDYTEKKHVRRIPGPLPGRVTYRGETTIRVRPTPAGAGGEP